MYYAIWLFCNIQLLFFSQAVLIKQKNQTRRTWPENVLCRLESLYLPIRISNVETIYVTTLQPKIKSIPETIVQTIIIMTSIGIHALNGDFHFKSILCIYLYQSWKIYIYISCIIGARLTVQY